MLTINTTNKIINGKEKLSISEEEMARVRKSYDFLKGFSSNKVIYGINTGFGPMAQWRVDDKYLKDLQYNIIRSHATGAGEPLDDKCVKAAMIARLGTFLQGKSGIHPDVVSLLLSFINMDIIPFIPRHGSVGASGDLVQLAHMALALIGEGKVKYHGQWRPAGEV
ncbi:MAG: aromatic amino acid ammonia-lyase, partial [Candidatus Cryptobacteroides sp.]|nr:aromatic amino acid ammonia-lyase [Candidatus Cryptobacteroides sp.]